MPKVKNVRDLPTNKAQDIIRKQYKVIDKQSKAQASMQKKLDIMAKNSAEKSAMIRKANMMGRVNAAATAGIIGYEVGSALNSKYGISSKLADKALEMSGAAGYGSSGRGKVFAGNAPFAGNDVDGESIKKMVNKKKPIKKK